MTDRTTHFPSHIASLSRSSFKYCASSVDFKAMYAVNLSANSRMVKRRPTGISLI